MVAIISQALKETYNSQIMIIIEEEIPLVIVELTIMQIKKGRFVQIQRKNIFNPTYNLHTESNK